LFSLLIADLFTYRHISAFPQKGVSTITNGVAGLRPYRLVTNRDSAFSSHLLSPVQVAKEPTFEELVSLSLGVPSLKLRPVLPQAWGHKPGTPPDWQLF
jgi:hypothetical protein